MRGGGSAVEVLIFEEAEGFADGLAGGGVAAGIDFGCDELLEFRGKRDLHGVFQCP